MKKFIAALVLSTLLASCTEDLVFNDAVIFDNLFWERRHYIEFEVPVDARESGYDFALQFVHNGSYAFDHIHMNITFYMPSGAMRSRDYEFRLQDEYGQWLGKKQGPFVETGLAITSGLRFVEDGICLVRVENKMTRFPVSGQNIKEVGLLVRKSKK